MWDGCNVQGNYMIPVPCIFIGFLLTKVCIINCSTRFLLYHSAVFFHYSPAILCHAIRQMLMFQAKK